MEKVDMMDIHTPAYVDRMDILPPYVGDGHSGQLALLTYTEKVSELYTQIDNPSFYL
jgi:hypothetical protein